MDIVWKILATLGLVGLNGFFVAAEFAAVGARASRLETQAATSLLARLSLDIKRRLDLYLSTCQLGITVASLGLGYVTEPAVAALLEPVLAWMGFHPPPGATHHPIAIIIALGISTALHVVVGEVAPKNWAIFYPDKLLPVVAVPLVIITYLCYPLIWALNAASNWLLRISGIHITHGAHGGMPHTVEEIRGLLAQAVAARGTDVDRTDHERILTSAFEFGDLKVRQIMTPRTQVDFLKLDQPIGDVLRIVRKTGYTRLPLAQTDIDHVVGFVHIKDLLNQLNLVPGKLRFTDERDPTGAVIAIADGKPGGAVHVIGSADIDLRKIKRDILFVPELLPVPKLLQQFQASRIHLAIVVDEYGATQGIVTLEDVVEQIVGDIRDEFDPAAEKPFVIDGENYRVSGLFPLHELRERLGLSEDAIDAEGVDTVGGYIVQRLNRWPRAGDRVELGPYVGKVVSVQNRRVNQVLLMPATQKVAQADGPGKV